MGQPLVVFIIVKPIAETGMLGTDEGRRIYVVFLDGGGRCWARRLPARERAFTRCKPEMIIDLDQTAVSSYF